MKRLASATEKSAARFFQNPVVSRELPARPMDNANWKNVGNATTARVASVQYNALPGNSSQPQSSITNVAVSVRLRRRLSKIFQREMMDSGLGTILPKKLGTFGSSQNTICQSPRTQRCFLLLNALICEG